MATHKRRTNDPERGERVITGARRSPAMRGHVSRSGRAAGGGGPGGRRASLPGRRFVNARAICQGTNFFGGGVSDRGSEGIHSPLQRHFWTPLSHGLGVLGQHRAVSEPRGRATRGQPGSKRNATQVVRRTRGREGTLTGDRAETPPKERSRREGRGHPARSSRGAQPEAGWAGRPGRAAGRRWPRQGTRWDSCLGR